MNGVLVMRHHSLLLALNVRFGKRGNKQVAGAALAQSNLQSKFCLHKQQTMCYYSSMIRSFLMILLFSGVLMADEIADVIAPSLTGGNVPEIKYTFRNKDKRGTKWVVSQYAADNRNFFAVIKDEPPLKLILSGIPLSDAFREMPEDAAVAFAADFAKAFVSMYPDLDSANNAAKSQRIINPAALGPAIFADALEDAGISPYYPPVSPESVSASGTDYGASVTPNVFYVEFVPSGKSLVLKFSSGEGIDVPEPTPNWNADKEYLPAAMLAISPAKEALLDTDRLKLQSVITGLKFRLHYGPYTNEPSPRTKILLAVLDRLVAKREAAEKQRLIAPEPAAIQSPNPS